MKDHCEKKLKESELKLFRKQQTDIFKPTEKVVEF